MKAVKTAPRETTDSPPAAPIEYAGQWVAWNETRTEVVSHGKDLATAVVSARAAGYPNPIMQRVRLLDERLTGTL